MSHFMTVVIIFLVQRHHFKTMLTDLLQNEHKCLQTIIRSAVLISVVPHAFNVVFRLYN